MKIPYQEIFNEAKKDLWVSLILLNITQHSENCNIDFSNVLQVELENFIVQCYQQWFMQLNAHLCADVTVEQQKITKHIKAFNDARGFLPNFTQELRALVDEWLQVEEGQRSPSLTEHCSEKVIKKHILIFFTHQKKMSSVNAKISNEQMFLNIESEAFDHAFKLYKKAFLDFVIAREFEAELRRAEEGSLINKELEHQSNYTGIDANKIKGLIQSHPELPIYTIPLKDGYTVFHLLCEYGTVALLSFLLEKLEGKNDILKSLPTPLKWDPKWLHHLLIASIKESNEKRVLLCVELGAKMNYVHPQTEKRLLHYATHSGHATMVRMFLEQGASPLRGPGSPFSALYWALRNDALHEVEGVEAFKKIEKTIYEIVEILLNAGADPEDISASREPVTKKVISGDTALQLAVAQGLLEVVRLLIARGANYQVTNQNKRNLLHIAAENGHEMIFFYLLDVGVSHQQTDREEKQPFQQFSASSQNSIKSRYVEWLKNQKKIKETLKKLDENTSNSSAEIKQEVIGMLKEGDCAEGFYKLAECYFLEKKMDKALENFKKAAQFGHKEAAKKLADLDAYLSAEKAFDNLLHSNGDSEICSVNDEDTLSSLLKKITSEHPVYGECAVIESVVHDLETLREPQEYNNKLHTFFHWARLCAALVEQQPFTLAQQNDINKTFQKLYNDWRVMIHNKIHHGDELLARFEKFNEASKRQVFLNGSLQPDAIFYVIIPYLEYEADALRCHYLPRRAEPLDPYCELARALTKLNNYYANETSITIWMDGRRLLPALPETILHSVATGRCYLSDAAMERLIPSLNVRTQAEKSGTHIVIPYEGMHFKDITNAEGAPDNTSVPGDADAVNASNFLIAPKGSAPACLLKLTRGGKQIIYLASLTIQGIRLDHMLRYHPEYITKNIDPYNFAAYISQLLTSYLQDDKDANIMTTFHPNKNTVPLTASSAPEKSFTIKLKSFDNDLAFGIPLLRDKEGKIYTEFLSVLFFFPQMSMPLDPQFIEDFLKIDPLKNCMQWLKSLNKKNGQYAELLKDHAFTKEEYFGNPDKNDDKGLRLPITLPKGFIEKRYGNLCKMQAYIRLCHQSGCDATPQGLFLAVEPLLAEVYKKINQAFPHEPQRAYEHIRNGDLSSYIDSMPLSFSATDSWNVDRVSLSDAASALMTCVNFSSGDPKEIFLQIKKKLPFMMQLIICHGSNISLKFLCNRVSKMKLTTLILAGEGSWTADDVKAIISNKKTSLRLVLQELDGKLPFAGNQLESLMAMSRDQGYKVFIRMGDNEFSLKLTAQSLLDKLDSKGLGESGIANLLKPAWICRKAPSSASISVSAPSPAFSSTSLSAPLSASAPSATFSDAASNNKNTFIQSRPVRSDSPARSLTLSGSRGSSGSLNRGGP